MTSGRAAEALVNLRAIPALGAFATVADDAVADVAMIVALQRC